MDEVDSLTASEGEMPLNPTVGEMADHARAEPHDWAACVSPTKLLNDWVQQQLQETPPHLPQPSAETISESLRLIQNHLHYMTKVGCTPTFDLKEELRSSFIDRLQRCHQLSVEQKAAKLQLFDGVFWHQPTIHSKARWLVRLEHEAAVRDSLLLLLPQIKARIQVFQSREQSNEPPVLIDEQKSPEPSLQYCVVCCAMAAGWVVRISSLKLSEQQILLLLNTVNQIRKYRKSSTTKSRHPYSLEELMERRICLAHLNEGGGIDERQQSQNNRTTPQQREDRYQIHLEAIQREAAEEILRIVKSRMSKLSTFIGKVKIECVSQIQEEIQSSIPQLMGELVDALTSLRITMSKRPDLQLITDHWKCCRSFQHDTTFSSIGTFHQFCHQENIGMLDALCGIFYLRGYSYRDIDARLNSWSLGASTIRRRTLAGISAFSSLMDERLKSARTRDVWEANTDRSVWPFANLPYVVDATYLFCFAGLNAEMLRATYCTNKGANLLKILSFTFLSGVPFWVSKVYPGDRKDQDILAQELRENPELLQFIRSEKLALPPRFAPLNSSALDLEHVFHGLPLSQCRGRPIGLLDRGFNVEALSGEFGLLSVTPAYLHDRVSFSQEESLLSAFLSSLRVIIENYHGRVKTFQALRGRLDIRVALKYGKQLWLAGAFLQFHNQQPLRKMAQPANRAGERDPPATPPPTSSDDDLSSSPTSPLLPEDDSDILADLMSEEEGDEEREAGSYFLSSNIEPAVPLRQVEESFAELHQIPIPSKLPLLNLPNAGDAPNWRSPLLNLLQAPKPKLLLLSSPRVTFDESSHQYFIDGDPVSFTYSGLFDRTITPFNPVAKALEMPNEHADLSMTPSDWLAKWKSDAMIGTVVHRLLECHYQGQLPRAVLAEQPEEVKARFMDIKNLVWNKIRDEWRVIGCELFLPDFVNFACGCLDLLLQSKKDPKSFLIIDFKTTTKSLADLSKRLSAANSTLGVSNTKLNAFALQLSLYRRAFLRLLDFDALSRRPIQMFLNSPSDQTEANQKHGIQVRIAVCTPTIWIDLSTPQYSQFAGFAERCVKKSAKISTQIRIARRFCELDIISKRRLVDFAIDHSERMRDNLNALLNPPRLSSKLKKLRQEHLPFIPAFSKEHILQVFESDRFCSGKTNSPTLKRAETVYAGSPVILRAALERTDNRITTYVSATGTSSRGATKKLSIVAFTIHAAGYASFASICNCVLGLTIGCAHRCRLLLEIIDRKFPAAPTRLKQSASAFRKRLDLLHDTQEKEKPKPPKRSCSREESHGATNDQELRWQSLHRYLPLLMRGDPLTQAKLQSLIRLMRDRAATFQIEDIQWPACRLAPETVSRLIDIDEQIRQAEGLPPMLLSVDGSTSDIDRGFPIVPPEAEEFPPLAGLASHGSSSEYSEHQGSWCTPER
jgi:hypothetical protein